DVSLDTSRKAGRIARRLRTELSDQSQRLLTLCSGACGGHIAGGLRGVPFRGSLQCGGEVWADLVDPFDRHVLADLVEPFLGAEAGPPAPDTIDEVVCPAAERVAHSVARAARRLSRSARRGISGHLPELLRAPRQLRDEHVAHDDENQEADQSAAAAFSRHTHSGQASSSRAVALAGASAEPLGATRLRASALARSQPNLMS